MLKAKIITGCADSILADSICNSVSTPIFSAFDSPRYTVFPGFCDVHVHFR